MKPINVTTFKDKWNAYKHDPKSLIMFLLVCLAAFITLAALAFVIVYISVSYTHLDVYKRQR